MAIIPARGGSKRIPRKNIKMFAGQPMLSYAVSVAIESCLFDGVFVSSDDDEILTLAAKLNATPIQRPTELADDFTPTVPVVAHALSVVEDKLKATVGLACCIYPAVPFLQIQDLRDALAMISDRGVPFVFPVVKFPTPVQRALRLNPDGMLSPLFSDLSEARSQDLETTYYDSGQFYWGARESWLACLNIHANGAGFVIPEWRSIDIDTPDDWFRAELMHRVLCDAR